jgi:chemotaxis protein CheX
MAIPFIEPEVLNCLENALKNVFQVQLSCDVQVDRDAAFSSSADVMAVLSLVSSKNEGSFGLFFPAQTVLGIYNQLSGENQQVVNAENVDSSSEILNIIYGSARTQINEIGNDFKPAIPTVVQGKNLSLSHAADVSIATLTCRCSLGDFQAQVGLKKTKAAV